MSGIEVIGLVLSAIPLFISAAEHYRDGLGFVKRAVRRRDFVVKYCNELIEQQMLLLLYLKAVVGRTELPPSVQATLIDSVNGDAWQNPVVIKALTEELANAVHPFTTLLEAICISLAKQIRADDNSTSATTDDEELVSRLQALCLKSSKKVDADKDGLSCTWDKIKFSWKHPERLALLEELKSLTLSLGKLANAVNGAKPYERKQQSRRVHSTFQLRNDTERLYQVLCRACTCQSHVGRAIGLGLAVHHLHSGEGNADLNFEIAILDSQNNGSVVSIKMTKATDVDPELPPKKKVRIGFTQASRASKPSTHQLEKLEDFCTAHQLARKGNHSLQLVIDEENEMYSINDAGVKRGQARNKPVPNGEESMLSLCDVMTNFKPFHRKRWMHREKAILAVILAYSLLQICHSSWWQALWTSENISFLGLVGENSVMGKNLDRRVRLRRPFTNSVMAEATSHSTWPASTTPRRNAHLHALGIVLLELYLNRSIKEEVADDGISTDCRGAALDLLDEHADNIDMTAEYLRAIRFCLSPQPNRHSGSFSFEDKGFRELFYSEVISMLEDNLSSRFEVGDDIWAQND